MKNVIIIMGWHENGRCMPCFWIPHYCGMTFEAGAGSEATGYRIAAE